MASSDVEALDSRLQQTCPETMNLESFLSELDLDGIARKERMSLVARNGRTLSIAIQKQAWKEAGVGRESAGEVDTYYYDQHGIVVVDLNSHEPEQ